VLWEEKSATWAGDEQGWAQNLADQLERYLRARECLPGYEDAPIGVRMTSSGVEAGLRQAIEEAVERFRSANPGVDVRVKFS
jgi:hypothetical protein